MDTIRPTVAACLIVRDEEKNLADCLQSLVPLVDEIVVFDTGSTDSTVEIACGFGATVVQGAWTGDFAAARNEALSFVRSEWVLSVDADEILVAEPGWVVPETEADGLVVDITQNATNGSYVSRQVKLFRRYGAIWAGRVHEQLVTPDGEPLPVQAIPASVLSFEHDGYADPARSAAKAERNVELGIAELDVLRTDPATSAQQYIEALMNLGRSLLACDRLQDAIDTFELVRSFGPDSIGWASATDFMARAALTAEATDAAVELINQLTATGHDEDYCSWLLGQAYIQLGHFEDALEIFDGIDQLIDPAGRRYDLAPLLEMRSLLEVLVDRAAA